MAQPDPSAMAVSYYRLQAEHAAAAAAAVAALLQGFDMADIDASWAAIAGQVVEIVAAYQLASALTAAAFFAGLLRSAGVRPAPQGVLPPTAFTGYSAAGVPLQTLADATPIVMKVVIQQSDQALAAPHTTPPRPTVAEPTAPALPAVPRAAVTPVQPVAPAAQPVPSEQLALHAATTRLTRIAGSEVQDAGRGMLEAQTRLEPAVTGWVRHVTPPACGRCLILAGRFYSKSAAFLRHPQCDCVQVPQFVSNPQPPSPRDLFHLMTDAQQDKAFTAAGARAIRDGADLGSVVNARRGMNAPGDDYTRVRAAGSPRRRHAPPRLSPQGAARLAGDDTVLYRQLLREHGYL